MMIDDDNNNADVMLSEFLPPFCLYLLDAVCLYAQVKVKFVRAVLLAREVAEPPAERLDARADVVRRVLLRADGLGDSVVAVKVRDTEDDLGW